MSHAFMHIKKNTDGGKLFAEGAELGILRQRRAVEAVSCRGKSNVVPKLSYGLGFVYIRIMQLRLSAVRQNQWNI